MSMEETGIPGVTTPPPEPGLDSRFVFSRIPGSTREEVLEEIALRMAVTGSIREPGELVRCLLDRERLGCTALGGGIAIPHCKLRDIHHVVFAVATTEGPIDFGAADGRPVDLIFLVASPQDAAAAHLQTLARISRLLRTPGVVDSLRGAATSTALLEALRQARAGSAASP